MSRGARGRCDACRLSCHDERVVLSRINQTHKERRGFLCMSVFCENETANWQTWEVCNGQQPRRTRRDPDSECNLGRSPALKYRCVVPTKLSRMFPGRNTDGRAKWLPVITAAANGRVHELQTLLRSGYHANECDADGTTALMMAASEGQSNAVRVLLREHANVHAADRMGTQALLKASKNGHIESMRLLLDAVQTWPQSQTGGRHSQQQFTLVSPGLQKRCLLRTPIRMFKLVMERPRYLWRHSKASSGL